MLTGLLKLIEKEKKGRKPTSLPKQFDLALEEQVKKSLSLYKDRSSPSLGYSAGAVFDCIPFFKKILGEMPQIIY